MYTDGWLDRLPPAMSAGFRETRKSSTACKLVVLKFTQPFWLLATAYTLNRLNKKKNTP